MLSSLISFLSLQSELHALGTLRVSTEPVEYEAKHVRESEENQMIEGNIHTRGDEDCSAANSNADVQVRTHNSV